MIPDLDIYRAANLLIDRHGSDALIEAARDLGAGQITAFNLVTLPLLMPSLVSSFLICFVTSFDEFAIASFLAPPGLPTYPVFLYSGSLSTSAIVSGLSVP